MRKAVATLAVAALVAVVWLLAAARPHAPARRALQVSATTPLQAQRWDARINRMIAAGDLEVRDSEADALLPGRTHDRLQQCYRGVPVFGGDLTRELDNGVPVSAFGQTYAGIDLDVTPALSAADAQAVVEAESGEKLGPSRSPRLVILPMEDGRYVLAYETQVAAKGDITRYFIDAQTGAVTFAYSNMQTQTASIGKGTGVLGDQKKVMTASYNNLYYALDKMRPASIYTLDMKSNMNHLNDLLNGVVRVGWSDYASTSNNEWTDGAVVDAQVYAGFMYDYFSKRMGRAGLDSKNHTLYLFVHPVSRDDVNTLYTDNSEYFTNAFYAGGGWMVFGEGLPPNFTVNRKWWNYTSAAIDIVAHELTHGVTEYSSNLYYRDESGALDEAFSDIMATSIEFYFQPRAADVVGNSATQTADYLEGEDAVRPGGLRSMADPLSKGNPDHYSLRKYVGTTTDGGGVHYNSTIVSHAFYLAVEGGQNRTSGRSVTGVGDKNREQVEKAFYRAFTSYLGSRATFSTARVATIQAARELYGAGSAAETAITQAWDAVGVTSTSSGSLNAETVSEPTSRVPAGRQR